jgi:hypothetical protein
VIETQAHTGDFKEWSRDLVWDFDPNKTTAHDAAADERFSPTVDQTPLN